MTAIVSLVPSLTEMICWLGCEEMLVGRTTFCTEPASVRGVRAYGGTKNPKVSAIVALRPDLVVANKEENRREDIEALRAAGLDVLVTDPNSVAEAVTMIAELAQRLGRERSALTLTSEIALELAKIPQLQRRVFVAIWKEPLMGLAADTYGHDLLLHAGGQNILAQRTRYPAVSRQEAVDLKPELILLPDEPYPFNQADADEWSTIAPTRVVDGKLLWWYGPRIPAALRELRALIERSGP